MHLQGSPAEQVVSSSTSTRAQIDMAGNMFNVGSHLTVAIAALLRLPLRAPANDPDPGENTDLQALLAYNSEIMVKGEKGVWVNAACVDMKQPSQSPHQGTSC